jgi:methyl-accepting chemotaxis protein
MILKKFFGLLMIIAALAGIVFCIIGIYEIWQVKTTLTQTVNDDLVLLDDTLIATENGLTSVGQLLQTTASDVTSLETTTQSLAQTIHDTNPMLDSLASLTGKDLPDAIVTTQTSLTAAQGSASLIDTVLGALTSIPFMPVTAYKPDIPLHTSLAQVSASLDSIPESLATIHTSLNSGKTNLGVIESEMTKISTTVKGISSDLEEVQKSIDQYKTVTTKLKTRVEAAKSAASDTITSGAWILTIILAWLMITQLGLLAEGLELLQRDRRTAEPAASTTK